jgi:DNA-binding GntR family transcriptional regulator
LNIAEIKNIYEIKAALEGLLVKSVSENIKGNFHEKFLKVIQEMKNAANANILDAWWKADNAMYDLLFEKANNQRLCRMIKDLNDQLLKIRLGVTALEGRMLRSTLEHEEIFECIIRGDGEKAEKLQKKHTLSVYRELERVLVHLVMPFLENGV